MAGREGPLQVGRISCWSHASVVGSVRCARLVDWKVSVERGLAPRDFGSRPAMCARPKSRNLSPRPHICLLRDMGHAIEPFVEERAWVVGVVSLWKLEHLGRICHSKDRSPNCNSRGQGPPRGLGALLREVARGSRAVQPGSVVRFLTLRGAPLIAAGG